MRDLTCGLLASSYSKRGSVLEFVCTGTALWSTGFGLDTSSVSYIRDPLCGLLASSYSGRNSVWGGVEAFESLRASILAGWCSGWKALEICSFGTSLCDELKAGTSWSPAIPLAFAYVERGSAWGYTEGFDSLGAPSPADSWFGWKDLKMCSFGAELLCDELKVGVAPLPATPNHLFRYGSK